MTDTNATTHIITDGVTDERDANGVNPTVTLCVDDHPQYCVSEQLFLDAVMAVFRDRLIRREPGDPNNGKPIFDDPHYDAQESTLDIFNEPALTEPSAVRWDISGGATLSIGYVDDDMPGGQLAATLNVSDYTQATGIAQRTVTRQQITLYALYLLRLAGAELTATVAVTVGGAAYGQGTVVLAEAKPVDA